MIRTSLLFFFRQKHIVSRWSNQIIETVLKCPSARTAACRQLNVYVNVTQHGFIIWLTQRRHRIGQLTHMMETVSNHVTCSEAVGAWFFGEPVMLQDLIATGNVVYLITDLGWVLSTTTTRTLSCADRRFLGLLLITVPLCISDLHIQSFVSCREDVFSGPNTNIPHTQPANPPPPHQSDACWV